MIDQTFAHFRITAKLGEGGMGTVYRAEDTKLGRDVALKFLPVAFAADAERLARFTREAQVLASLNHPNIAGIYSVEEATRDGSEVPVIFLVMELVEGQTLQERIAAGSLGVDEAVRITLQLATGLEEAHERGIIHRDLKPANIKLTPDKQVKILDFGLAKAFDPDSPNDSLPSGPAAQRLSLSPTMTGLATQVGMLLGTAAYMSPEQARGEPVDRRADVWALGVVLMEMLTGKVVHQGKTLSDTLASVLAREPDWGQLPADLPRPVRRVLDRCLQKESRDRMRDVGEARIAIERYLEAPDTDEDDRATVEVAMEAAPTWKRLLPWVVAASLAVGLLVTIVARRPSQAPPSSPVRLSLALPADQNLFTGYGASAVLSPDGSRVAYVLGTAGSHRLELRGLNQWEGTLLVEGAAAARPYQPFFSPDGNWVGFVTTVEMRKVPVTGGTPIKLCDVNRSRGASWGPDGTIVFTPDPGSPLMQVAEAGGEPQPLTELDNEKGELTHRWPQWLPGGRAVLFTSHTKQNSFDEGNIEVFDIETGERSVVLRGGSYGRYVETAEGSGYVIYANSGSLFAVSFDRKQLKVTGSAAPVVEGVTFAPNEGSAQYSTSSDGKLAYTQGVSGVAGHSMVLVDRQGEIEPLWDDQQLYLNPAFSPDGTSIAVEVVNEGQTDIWIYDIERRVPTRLTFVDTDDRVPVWTPDGEYIYYGMEVDGTTVVSRKLADGSGEPEEVFAADVETLPMSISSDGQNLYFVQQVTGSNWDVGVLRLDDTAEPRMLLTTPFLEFSPTISPNGRWLAYVSDESGSFELYVRAIEGRGKWQISSGGGGWPDWSPDGKQLFFWHGSELNMAEVDTEGATFRAGRAELLFEGSFVDLGNDCPVDISPDGQRFVTFQNQFDGSSETHQHVQLVLNWYDELRATFGK